MSGDIGLLCDEGAGERGFLWIDKDKAGMELCNRPDHNTVRQMRRQNKGNKGKKLS